MFVRCMLHRSYTAWRNECKPKPAGKITWQLRGECLIVGQSYCFVAVTAGFSMSQTNCLTILLATSALAPLYFAPLLSCVVAHEAGLKSTEDQVGGNPPFKLAAIKAKLKGELSPAWCGVTKAPFLNSKNVGLIHDLDEFFHSLGDLKTSVYDFVAKFGVPDGI